MPNPIIDAMLNRKSIRKYTDEVPSEETLHEVVRAGQQAPFAAQACSLLLTRERKKIPFHAPLYFIICGDFHKLELIMAKRNWRMISNDLELLVFSMLDATLMAENLIIAAESVGMGSCCIGMEAEYIESIRKKYELPERVLPLMGLTMGYPDEDAPPRPRYPLDFFLFEDKYPKFTDRQIERAMAVMDEGYMAQDYYSGSNLMIKLEGDRPETHTFDTYGWTEHMARKWGQWWADGTSLLRAIANCGFRIAEMGARSDREPA
jgi:nitroreductase